ncbi:MULTISPECIES: bifunctional DNA primase/polymerase [unclassified Streptomyces]|uniref:bifunctional DNA primase/polymerase n=1 Tax=unclassified Streptomyces TaxID=2593676 RepID=UPI00380EB616
MPSQSVTSSPSPTGLGTSHAVARWCAQQGWPVHPLAPGHKTPAANCPACKTDRHRPSECPCILAGGWCHGFHAATTLPEQVDAWWAQQPRSGVGVSCGPANLVVIDVDAHAAEVPDRSRLLPGIPIAPSVNLDGLATGFDTLALLAALRRQPSPAQDEQTLRVRTPSGGLHVWYLNPCPASHYRSSTGSSPKTALAWQVDVRAHGGYIVAPGTKTAAGVYTRVGQARHPAFLPDWLAAELNRTGHLPEEQATTSNTPPPKTRARRAPKAAHRVLQPLLDEVAACAAVSCGASFTEKLNRAAFTAGGLVQTGHLVMDEIRELLCETARQARPHQESRNNSIIDSALSAGAQRPFHLKGRS